MPRPGDVEVSEDGGPGNRAAEADRKGEENGTRAVGPGDAKTGG